MKNASKHIRTLAIGTMPLPIFNEKNAWVLQEVALIVYTLQRGTRHMWMIWLFQDSVEVESNGNHSSSDVRFALHQRCSKHTIPLFLFNFGFSLHQVGHTSFEYTRTPLQRTHARTHRRTRTLTDYTHVKLRSKTTKNANEFNTKERKQYYKIRDTSHYVLQSGQLCACNNRTARSRVIRIAKGQFRVHFCLVRCYLCEIS